MVFLRKIISVILKRLKIQADILQSFSMLFSSFSGNLFNGCVSCMFLKIISGAANLAHSSWFRKGSSQSSNITLFLALNVIAGKCHDLPN